MHSTIFDSPISRYREEGKPDAKGLAIDVHIIAPGHGSSGYYSEQVLKKACESGVYPRGMHMHWDHPTATQESEQPARSLKDLVGVLTESGRYDANGWDGPGVYAKAKIFPEWVDSIKAMDGHIGISHYVSGVSEDGTAPDGKKCPLIKELIADPLNTVDFVTVPGAGGKYRTLFGEVKARTPGVLLNSSGSTHDMERGARVDFRNSLISTREFTREAADRMAGILPGDEIIPDDLKKAREDYRDTLLKTGMCQTKEEANKMAGLAGD
jgi:hypothetical protein